MTSADNDSRQAAANTCGNAAPEYGLLFESSCEHSKAIYQGVFNSLHSQGAITVVGSACMVACPKPGEIELVGRFKLPPRLVVLGPQLDHFEKLDWGSIGVDQVITLEAMPLDPNGLFSSPFREGELLDAYAQKRTGKIFESLAAPKGVRRLTAAVYADVTTAVSLARNLLATLPAWVRELRVKLHLPADRIKDVDAAVCRWVRGKPDVTSICSEGYLEFVAGPCGVRVLFEVHSDMKEFFAEANVVFLEKRLPSLPPNREALSAIGGIAKGCQVSIADDLGEWSAPLVRHALYEGGRCFLTSSYPLACLVESVSVGLAELLKGRAGIELVKPVAYAPELRSRILRFVADQAVKYC